MPVIVEWFFVQEVLRKLIPQPHAWHAGEAAGGDFGDLEETWRSSLGGMPGEDPHRARSQLQ
jgi:hypothetical protein